jgi:hypothetical protein
MKVAIFLVVATSLIVNLFAGSRAGVSDTSGLFEFTGDSRALLGAAGVAVCGSMIFFSRLWSDYILPLGLLSSLASDAGQSERSALAMALLGWVLLALMAVSVLASE